MINLTKVFSVFSFFSKKERMRRTKRDMGKSVIPLGQNCQNCPYLQDVSFREEDVWRREEPVSFCWFLEKNKKSDTKICGE